MTRRDFRHGRETMPAEFAAIRAEKWLASLERPFRVLDKKPLATANSLENRSYARRADSISTRSSSLYQRLSILLRYAYLRKMPAATLVGLSDVIHL